MKKKILFVSFLFLFVFVLVGCGKSVPVVKITDVVPTKTSVSFDVSVEDETGLGEIKAIELYLDSQKIKELEDFNNLLFTDLLSNSQYTIKVSYEYSLEKNNEPIIAQQEFKTYAKSSPTYKFADIHATDDTISFSLDIVDDDLVSSVEKIELYSGTELILNLENLNDKKFSDLDYKKDYYIKLTYTYNLNDGVEEKEKEIISQNIIMQNPTFNVEVEDVDGSLLFKGEIVKEKEFDLITALSLHSKIKLDGSTSEYGYFVTSVCGVEANGDLFQFWSLEVNGVESMVGISDLVVNKGDTISFILTTWQ